MTECQPFGETEYRVVLRARLARALADGSEHGRADFAGRATPTLAEHHAGRLRLAAASFPDAAEQLGHTDGGALLARLYFYADKERALDSIARAFERQACKPNAIEDARKRREDTASES